MLQLYKSEYRSSAWSTPVLANGYSVSSQALDYAMMFMFGMGSDSAKAAAGGGDAVIIWLQKDGTTNCSGVACSQLYKAEYR